LPGALFFNSSISDKGKSFLTLIPECASEVSELSAVSFPKRIRQRDGLQTTSNAQSLLQTGVKVL